VEEAKLKPIPLSTFMNFGQFRKAVGVDESTSSCLKVLQRAVDGSGLLFRSDSLMVQRINPIVEAMPSTDVLESRTIYLDGFPLPEEIVMQSRLLAKNGEKSGNTYFDYDNNIMQLPEKKAAEQFIDHAFIKKSIVHFAKCQSEDIALVRYNAVFGYAFVEFSRDMDLEHICIRLSHKNTVWRRRNEPIRPLYKFINDNFTSGSSFNHENTQITKNTAQNNTKNQNLTQNTTTTKTAQESAVQQPKKRQKVQENKQVTKFCSFKVRAITMYQWLDLNKTCARLQTRKWGKAKIKLAQEVKRCKQRDVGQMGITFDDDMDNYTIRAVSTILEGTPARMMGFREDEFNEGFQVLEHSDSESVGNSEKSDVLSLGESENEKDETTNDKENCDSWRQNSQTSDFSETENNKMIEQIRKRKYNEIEIERISDSEPTEKKSKVQEPDPVEVKEEFMDSTAPLYATDLVYKVRRNNVLDQLSIPVPTPQKLNSANHSNLSDSSKKQIISSLKKLLYQYTLKYVDFSFHSECLFLRFENAQNAQKALIEEPVGLSLEKVNGEEELNYWRHLLACWSDCRMLKSRHRNLSKRYKPVDTKKKLVNKIEIFNDELRQKHIQLY
jgi:hypothetical protein